jgi:predicted dehydrogenase
VVFSALLFAAEPEPLRLIEVDPGHSHLSGLHSRMLPGASSEVHIYSPLSPELTAHLAAITRDNSRLDHPTNWSVRLFAGPDFLHEMEREKPGGIVALSGRNSANIAYIEAALRARHSVFADKPLIIDAQEFPRLETALKLAEQRGLIVDDWMTLREEPPYRLVRDLVGEESVFGAPVPGSVDRPSVQLENLHALLKYSNKVPQKRPAAFVDVRQQGEGMADVGTHIADLAQWTLFPNQTIAYRTDIRMLQASHAALSLSLEQFTQLTGESAWPTALKDRIVDGKLIDYTNGTCVYTLKGVHVRLKVGWQYEAPPGDSDSYFASFLGTRALVELRAGPKERFLPEIWVTPSNKDASAWEASLRSAVDHLQAKYPGLSIEKSGSAYRIVLPKSVGGDSLQALFRNFAGFVRDPASLPSFANSNLLAKYYVTTTAVAMANGKR